MLNLSVGNCIFLCSLSEMTALDEQALRVKIRETHYNYAGQFTKKRASIGANFLNKYQSGGRRYDLKTVAQFRHWGLPMVTVSAKMHCSQ